MSKLIECLVNMSKLIECLANRGCNEQPNKVSI